MNIFGSYQVKVAIIIALIIIGVGTLLGLNFKFNVYEPGMKTQSVEAATQAAIDANIAKQKATEDALAFRETQTVQAEQATIQAMKTLEAIPTPTPEVNICQAITKEDTSIIFSNVPGILYKNIGGKELPANSIVSVDGALEEKSWVHVTANDQSGFVRREDIVFSDSGCEPTISDIHYLAGWLNPGEKVIVDDSFSSNEYTWINTADNTQIANNVNKNESTLFVESGKIATVFSTKSLSEADVASFRLYTYIKSVNHSNKGYFGFRFAVNEAGYYELRLSPNDCIYTIYDSVSDSIIHKGPTKSGTCSYDLYSIDFSVTTKGELTFNINGEQYGPTKLANLENRDLHGGISLSVVGVEVDYNYIVVIAPK